MNKISKSFITKFILIFFIAVSFVLSLVLLNREQADRQIVFADSAEIINTDNAIKDVYTYKSRETFPESIKVNYLGAELDGVYFGVQDSSGDISTRKNVTFAEVGSHYVLYSFKDAQGAELLAREKFTVSKTLYDEFTGASSVSYGRLEYLSKDTRDASGYIVENDTNGLIVNLGIGDTFTFNKPINVNETSLTDVITLFPRQLVTHYRLTGKHEIPEGEPSSVECNEIIVTLTDAYDSSIYVKAIIRFNTDYSEASYLTVITEATNIGKSYIQEAFYAADSWEVANYKYTTIDGVRYRVAYEDQYINDYYYGVRISDLIGSRAQSDYVKYPDIVTKYAGTIQFDSQHSQLFYATNDSNVILGDLDNPNVKQSESVFPGFTTGEVYVSVQGNGYIQSKPTTIEISSIGNYSGEDLAQLYAIDDVAPQLILNTKNQEKTEYTMAVNELLELPTATVIDCNVFGEVKPMIYLNYGKPSQTIVNYSNNVFVPTEAGKYTIVYTAYDTFGNSASKSIDLLVVKDGEENFTFNTVKLQTVTVGEVVSIPQINIENRDGNGDVTYNVIITDSNGNDLEISNGAFRPTVAGEYKLSIIAEDDLFSAKYFYNFNVQSDQRYFFVDDVNFQKYYIKNATYTFDDYYAYANIDGEIVSKLADLYVKVGADGEFEKAENYVYSFIKIDQTLPEEEQVNLIQDGAIVTFKYVCEGHESDEYTALIRDVQYKETKTEKEYDEEEDEWYDQTVDIFDASKYFVGDYKSGKTNNGVMYTLNTTSGSTSMEFINPIALDSFNLKFALYADTNEFSQMNVRLTDTANPNNVIKLSLIYENYHTYMSINDGVKYDVTTTTGSSATLAITENVTRSIIYKSTTNRFSCVGGKESVLINNPNEIAKNVYLSIEFEDISGPTAIEIIEVCSQVLNLTRDNRTPFISVKNSRGNYSYGSIVSLYEAYVSDVLSPVTIKDVKLSVTDSTGAYVEDVDGLLLKEVPATRVYKLKVTDASYDVKYVGLKDGYGNKKNEAFKIFVVDTTAPTITFDDGSTEETAVRIQVGEIHEVKAFTVADDKSTGEDLKIVVVSVNDIGNWENNLLQSDGTYKFFARRVGIFKIRVIAVDAAKNISYTHYNVLVEPATATETEEEA